MEINQITNEMREIADGLGSGVTPEQLEASVELGKQWLAEIEAKDFNDERQTAIEKQQAANELVRTVKDFASPVENFKMNVTEVEGAVKTLDSRLTDLDNNGNEAMEKVNIIC